MILAAAICLILCGLGCIVLPVFGQWLPTNLAVATPVFGLAIALMLASTMYLHGASIHQASLTLAILVGLGALIAIAFLVRYRRRRDLRWGGRLAGAWLAVAIASIAAVAGLASATSSTAQGNRIDHFNYTSAAIIYASQSATVVRQGPPTPVSPLYPPAQALLNQRPSVAITYAAIVKPLAPLYKSGYLFLLVLLIAWFAAGMTVGMAVIPSPSIASTLVIGAASFTAAFGFYAQMNVDIGAWSAHAAVPLYTASLAFSISAATSSTRRTSGVLGSVIIAGWLYGVAFSTYPEGGPIFMLPTLLIFVFAVIAHDRHRMLVVMARTVAPLVGVFVLTTTIISGTTAFSYSWQAYTWISPTPPEWWLFFDTFLTGSDVRTLQVLTSGDLPTAAHILGMALPVFLVALTGTIAIGVLGIYFLTSSNIAAFSAVTAATMVLISVGACLLAEHAIRILRRRLRAPQALRSGIAAAAALGAIAILLALRHQYWAFGKELTWASPFTIVVVCAIAYVAIRSGAFSGRILAGIVVLWIACQITFFATWATTVRTEGANHRSWPYPVASEALAKLDWDIDAQARELASCKIVTIRDKDGLHSWYLRMLLDETGTAVTGTPDCELRTDATGQVILVRV